MEPKSETRQVIINVGTRKSELARIQTNLVVRKLEDFYLNNPDRLESILVKRQLKSSIQSSSDAQLSTLIKFNVIAMSTTGDQVLDKPLPSIGTKSLFTRELEFALLDSRLDFVVHSLKDLPTCLPENCVIGAILQRDDPNDAIVLTESLRDQINPIDLLLGREPKTKDTRQFKIGTSSQRRIAMIKRCNPSLECTDIRGNLNTRFRKLDDPDNNYAAIILAKAGLDRMGWSNRASSLLTPNEDSGLQDWCYAVGQGAIAVECRSDDQFILELLEPVVDLRTTYEAIAERSFMRKLEGGCSVPLGVRSVWTTSEEAGEEVLNLETIVLSLDGDKTVRARGRATLVSSGRREEGGERLLAPEQSLELAPCPTGITLSRVALESSATRANMSKCSELGIEVANKMIDLGCLELMNRERH